VPFTLLDVEASAPGGWAGAFVRRPAGLDALLDGFGAQAHAKADARLGCAGWAALAGLQAILDLLHRWHGSRYGAELDLLAAASERGRAELLLANLAYDLGTLGCSTFLQDGRAGPLHARNLDWPFPGTLLRRHGCVLRVHGAPAGGYAVVGWPGLVGALTAVAPGRFTVSVNFVRHRHGGLGRLLARAARGALPVPWAVRDALDHARTFAEATERLRRAPLLAPVLLALAGPRRGEAVVLERTACGAELRRPLEGALCLANHYQAAGLARASVDYDEGGSSARLALLERGLARSAPADAGAALRLLAPAVRPETQQQVVMRARDGLFVVRVPGERARAIDLTAIGGGGARRPARSAVRAPPPARPARRRG